MEISTETLMTFAITFPVFVFSLSLHEAAHAIAARWGGDLTAQEQGRITLNPLSHMDPIGTVIMPMIVALMNAPLLAWARPVPFVETNFRRGRGFGSLVALAGPFANLLIAIATVIIMQCIVIALGPDAMWLIATSGGGTAAEAGGGFIPANLQMVLAQFLFYMLAINISLMCFNLLPIPPLDGSHLLWYWVIQRFPALHEPFMIARQGGFIILLILINTPVFSYYAREVIEPLIDAMLKLGIGVHTFVS